MRVGQIVEQSGHRWLIVWPGYSNWPLHRHDTSCTCAEMTNRRARADAAIKLVSR